MLDLNFIQSNPDLLKKQLEKRKFENPELAGKILFLIQEKKELLHLVETLRSEKNKTSKEAGILKSKGGDIAKLSADVKKINTDLTEKEATLNKVENELNDLNLILPNFLDEEVPEGSSESDNVKISEFGNKPAFNFTPKTHFEIGENQKIMDFEKGVKLAGARFYTYFGLGARLERALMNFMLDTHAKDHGYNEVWVPLLVNDASMEVTGQYPKFKDEYYRMDKDELNLIPTAEVPLTNLYRDEIVPLDSLPINVMAHTSCFRREAGSYGRDTRGLVRVHQFQKVELVKIVEPDRSKDEHLSMLSHAENILKKLNLHYQVLLLCSKDTSNSSSLTYDIEVWMPGLNRYMEISSVSNFKDYQARRGKIRFKDKDGKNKLVHTINGSGLAIGRTLAAVIENYQTSDGNFAIPEVLKKYL